MVAVVKLRPANSEPVVPIARSSGPLHLIHGSFSSRRIARQYPFLAGTHRLTDGALWGVLIAVLMMSAFSLHWRHLWTVAYVHLETTRELTQKLKFSTAMLEQHLLKRTSLPMSMVRTNAKKLHYLEHLDFLENSKEFGSEKHNLLKKIRSFPVNYGY